MTVARVTEVIGMSPLGWKEALDEALNRANKTLRNITHVEILRQDATISNGYLPFHVHPGRLRLRDNPCAES